MKPRIILKYCLYLLLTFGQNSIADSTVVAATVQGAPISESKLQTSINFYIKQQGGSEESIKDPVLYKQVREQVLDVLIGQQLLWSAAQKDSIIVEDEAVTKAFDAYQQKFEDQETFEGKLSESGFNKDSFRENLKQQKKQKVVFIP